ncbi:hypothetical protein A2U01_0028723, partial [Trifolium medium]|nr:hypothetical protein [Trifolium medium]
LTTYTHTPPFTHINISLFHTSIPKVVRSPTSRIPFVLYTLIATKSFKAFEITMSKSTRSSAAKNNKGSSIPDEFLYSKITQAYPVTTVLPQESRKMRTKSVAVRPKRVPKVSKTSTSSELYKHSENRRMKSTAGRNKGKGSQNLGDNASPSVIRPTGGVSDNVAASSRAKFWSDDENDGVPEKETSKNVRENVVPDTPEVNVRSEKVNTPGNVLPGDASVTNTVANSPSESMHTEPEVVEVNDTTSEEEN